MEFVNDTDYDWRALRALNRAAIRLDRRWRSLLLRAMGVLCGLILLRGAWTSGGGEGPVSYTHLTLPTICSV